MHLLALDPSGSFYEGKGTTGWALFDRKTKALVDFGCIRASDYPTQSNYWQAVTDLLDKANFIVIEDYLLYASKAQSQINSRLETPKLIGILQHHCALHNKDYRMQRAVEVVNRWSDKILEHRGIVVRKSTHYYALDRVLNNHIRDAIRHGVHYLYLKQQKEK